MGLKANYRKDKPRRKPHNHFPQGKTGYVPRGVGIIDLQILRECD